MSIVIAVQTIYPNKFRFFGQVNYADDRERGHTLLVGYLIVIREHDCLTHVPYTTATVLYRWQQVTWQGDSKPIPRCASFVQADRLALCQKLIKCYACHNLH